MESNVYPQTQYRQESGGHHGGNRAKNKALLPDEREATRKCLLCGIPDSSDHWLNECMFGHMQKLRLDI